MENKSPGHYRSMKVMYDDDISIFFGTNYYLVRIFFKADLSA